MAVCVGVCVLVLDKRGKVRNVKRIEYRMN